MGTQQGIKLRKWIFVGFQEKDRRDSQKLNNDTFYRPPVTNAQCNIGIKEHPDSAIF